MRQTLTRFMIAIMMLAGLTALAQVKDYRDIRYPEPKTPNIVQPTRFELKNGLTVLLLEDHELPVVKGRILFHTGSVQDPKGKEGLAALVGDTMRSGGNKLMSGDAMDEYLESIAASVETFAGDTSSGGSFSCLKENADKVLQLFAATLMTPAFEADKVDVAKQQMKTGIMRRNDDPKAIATREFSRRIYGLDSPLSAMEELASVDAITVDDLKAFHAAGFVPNNAVLAVWGDIDAGAMKKKLQALFAGWRKSPAPKLDLRIQPEKPGVYFVHRDGVTQSNIVVGHLGVKRDNPDLPAIVLFSRLLGGGFDSRMMQIIRRDLGLSYSPHGGIGANWEYPGSFSMRVNTKLGSTGKVLDTLTSIIHDMQTNGVTREELDLARDAYLNAFVFQFDSLDKIIGRALATTFYGYPADFTEKLFDGLKKVTTDDVKRVANQYVNLDKAIIMVVGDESKFDKPLSEYGPVTTVDVTIPKPAVEQPKAEVSAESLAKGTALLQAAFRKIDPDGKLKTVRIWKLEAEVAMDRGGMAMTMGMVSAIRYTDNSVFQEMKTQMGAIKLLITPEKAEMSMGPNSQPIPEQQKAQLLGNIAKSLPAVAQVAFGDEPKANLVKTGEFNGQPAAFVAVPAGDSPLTVMIGKDGTILGTTEQVMDRTGSLVTATSVWKDWKDFGGIRYPGTVEQTQDEAKSVITVKAVSINPEDGDTLFQ